jgi:hypothetical protein
MGRAACCGKGKRVTAKGDGICEAENKTAPPKISAVLPFMVGKEKEGA